MPHGLLQKIVETIRTHEEPVEVSFEHTICHQSTSRSGNSKPQTEASSSWRAKRPHEDSSSSGFSASKKFFFLHNIIQDISGYGDGDPNPPSTGGDDVCPFCRLSPCIIAQPPNWLRGSAQASLNNITKRYKLYKKFWILLDQLGVWNDPYYLALKVTKTSINDRRDVMPSCIVTVSYE